MKLEVSSVNHLGWGSLVRSSKNLTAPFDANSSEFATQKKSTYGTAGSRVASFENLSSLGFFRETFVKFSGTRNAFS